MRDRHHGGCFYCAHLLRGSDGAIDPRWRCAHPGYPLPTPYMDARDDAERCGPHGAWWEPLFELSADAGGACRSR